MKYIFALLVSFFAMTALATPGVYVAVGYNPDTMSQTEGQFTSSVSSTDSWAGTVGYVFTDNVSVSYTYSAAAYNALGDTDAQTSSVDVNLGSQLTPATNIYGKLGVRRTKITEGSYNDADSAFAVGAGVKYTPFASARDLLLIAEVSFARLNGFEDIANVNQTIGLVGVGYKF